MFLKSNLQAVMHIDIILLEPFQNTVLVRNHVKLGVSLRVLYCVVDTGYGLGRSLGGLQTCIAGRTKVPNDKNTN